MKLLSKSFIKQISLIVSVLFLSITAYTQVSMSITGNYNIATFDLQNNFQNGYGATAEIFYNFHDSPFMASLSFSTNSFRATSEYEAQMKEYQNDAVDLNYQIHTLVTPIHLAADYHFFREKKLQVLMGIGLGLNIVTDKVKQVGQYTSDYTKDIQYYFGVNPHFGLIYQFEKDLGVLLKTGCNRSLGGNNVSYADIRLGLIYKI